MSVGTAPDRTAANAGRPTDREGFYISEDALRENRDDSGLPLQLSKKAIETERRRERKWLEMLSRWDDWMLTKPKKIKARCRKGIPASLRGRAWLHLCGANKMMESNPGVFEELQRQADAVPSSSKLQEYMEVIERDLDRTFPHHERFAIKGGDGQVELRKVLRAYVMYNQSTGYCQGMGMLVGTLMMQMTTEEAFWCMVAMLNSYVKGYFDSGLKEIQICSSTLHNLLAMTNSGLHAHLDAEGVTPILYFTDWFMCCYVTTLPWQTVLRVWDMVFFEGDKIFFRVALAVLALSKKSLLQDCREMHNIMQYLRNLPPQLLFVNRLIPTMLKLPLKRDMIDDARERAVVEYKRDHPEPDPTPPAKPTVPPLNVETSGVSGSGTSSPPRSPIIEEASL